jgi:hypothetical protein
MGFRIMEFEKDLEKKLIEDLKEYEDAKKYDKIGLDILTVQIMNRGIDIYHKYGLVYAELIKDNKPC